MAKKSPERCSGLSRLPVAIVAMAVRAAVVGIRSGSVIGRSVIPVVAGTVIAIAGPISVTVSAGCAGRDRAGSQTERKARAYAARLCRRRNGGGANRGDRRQDRKCLFHMRLPALLCGDNASALQWFQSSPSASEGKPHRIAPEKFLNLGNGNAGPAFSLQVQQPCER